MNINGLVNSSRTCEVKLCDKIERRVIDLGPMDLSRFEWIVGGEAIRTIHSTNDIGKRTADILAVVTGVVRRWVVRISLDGGDARLGIHLHSARESSQILAGTAVAIEHDAHTATGTRLG